MNRKKGFIKVIIIIVIALIVLGILGVDARVFMEGEVAQYVFDWVKTSWDSIFDLLK